MTGLAKHAGDLWVGRYTRSSASVIAARATVAHLKPIVVITGASRGIGAALAERFSSAGYPVAIVARHAGELEMMAARLRDKTGQTILPIVCDITLPSAAAGIDETLAANGFYLDILVNNAGIGLSGYFEQHSQPDLDTMVALNIAALTRLMHHGLKGMRARQRGGILNVASLGGAGPGPFQAAHYASKGYVIALTEAVAAENRGDGVRFSVLAPGPVDTGFHAAMNAERARYRLLLPALTVQQAASAAFWGFTISQRLIVPGVFNRLLYVCLRFIPHAVTVPVVRWLLRPP